MKKEKYLQIFRYLKEFSKLHSKPVRDIENQTTQYPEVIWLDEIPVSDLFENILRPGFETDNEYWLKIKKPKEPAEPRFGTLSTDLLVWIEEGTLLVEEDFPKIKECIEQDGKKLLIQEYPEIKTRLQQYFDTKWLSDLKDYKAKHEIFKIAYNQFEKYNESYKKFFQIYNKYEKFGEEYELVVGVGLLHFQLNKDSPKIFRHIATQEVGISFGENNKDFSILIQPNYEKSIKVETDSILDLEDIFHIQNIITAEKNLENYIAEKEISSLFSGFEEGLDVFAKRIFDDGRYLANNEKPRQTPQKPTVSFSPALILRKRNTQSFTQVYEEIISQLETTQEDLNIGSLNELAGIENPRPVSSQESEGTEFMEEPVFFPKEFNDEQIEIVNKTRKYNQVLVQGPPGTGKSHTIANLICHLLAGGNKVLVTAYTKRALEVLQGKLPEQFQSLVINLLSGDSSSVQDLQRCINSINEEFNRASPSEYKREIESSLKSLSEIKKEIAETKNKLVDVRELATRSHILNELYSGSLIEIARLLEEKETDLAWYKDVFHDGSDSSVIQNLSDFHREFVHYKEATERHFDFSIPYSEKLISHPELDEYSDLLKIEKEESSSAEAAGLSITSSNFPQLLSFIQEILRFNTMLNDLRDEDSEILFKQLETSRIKEIQESIRLSGPLLRNLEQTDLWVFERDTEIQYPVDKTLIRLKNDGTILLQYLRNGNPLSGLVFNIKKPFLPKPIKEKLYFIEEVLVNGSPCDSIEEFELVLKDIAIRQDLKGLSEIWKLEPMKGKKPFQNFSELKSLVDTAIKLVHLYSEAQLIRQKIEAISNLKVDLFNRFELETAQRGIRLKDLKNNLDRLKKKLDSSLRHLAEDVTHPIREKLSATVSNIDVDKYQQLSEELSQIRKVKEAHSHFCEKREQLFSILPNSVQGIETEEISSIQVEMVREAFFHRDAKRKIEKLKDADFEVQLSLKLAELEKKEKDTIARLSSKKAWLGLISNLIENRSLKQDLDAWALAVQKIGKGKGKRAGKFRKLAQESMKKAKDAVPCWIMPLYKVAETIVPQREMYDYVIIDEASQLGPDSLFLLYISKNIIIVGDDKQTSPEYVGVDANSMTPHINRHLKGIPRAEYFGMEFSLFDHARLFCGGDTVVLREHFRCMPEIIEFSNKHFYAPEGKALYPLKQYSENRLDPLVSVFCNKGYTEGSYSNIVNPPEAEEVANAVAKIVKDPSYNGKSIGIITLQGNSQAAKIENLILKLIDSKEFHKRKIICGNSTSFQGDERDIILLSLVTAPNHNRAALVTPQDERRFNVAVSRAKEQIWLFHSVKLDDLTNQNDLRYKLLHHFLHYSPGQTILAEPIERSMGSQPAPFESWFEVDVFNDLIKRQIKVIPAYEVARGRYRIDLVTVLADGTKIAIECDGDKWHGPEQHLNDILRQKVLERCGWQFFRIRGHEYYSNREKALEPLWKLIEKQSSQASREETKKSVSQELTKEEEDFIESFQIPEDDEEQTEFDGPITIPNRPEPDTQLPLFPAKNESKDKIIRYFNLFRDAKFRITADAPITNADFVVPVYEHQRNGFILQCYDTGYVNKVSISALFAKKIGKEYWSGMNTAARLVHIEATDSEKILGIYFTENRERKFKAHLTDKMEERDRFHLQGYKVMYNEFERIEFRLIPLEYQQKLDRLIFTSFNASGKPLSNKYYEAEWTVLSRIIKAQPAPEFKPEPEVEEKPKPEVVDPTFIRKPIGKSLVTINSIVTLRYLSNNDIVKVKIVNRPTDGNDIENGIQLVGIDKPLAVSLMGKGIGEMAKIASTGAKVLILNIE